MEAVFAVKIEWDVGPVMPAEFIFPAAQGITQQHSRKYIAILHP